MTALYPVPPVPGSWPHVPPLAKSEMGFRVAEPTRCRVAGGGSMGPKRSAVRIALGAVAAVAAVAVPAVVTAPAGASLRHAPEIELRGQVILPTGTTYA